MDTIEERAMQLIKMLNADIADAAKALDDLSEEEYANVDIATKLHIVMLRGQRDALAGNYAV